MATDTPARGDDWVPISELIGKELREPQYIWITVEGSMTIVGKTRTATANFAVGYHPPRPKMITAATAEGYVCY